MSAVQSWRGTLQGLHPALEVCYIADGVGLSRLCSESTRQAEGNAVNQLGCCAAQVLLQGLAAPVEELQSSAPAVSDLSFEGTFQLCSTSPFALWWYAVVCTICTEEPCQGLPQIQLPLSVVTVYGVPKWGTHVVMNASGTVSVVLSWKGTVSGQQMNL